ncbi:MAG: zinc ribbon domain-containing protein [Pyrinomonadaceae bacterium]
MAETVVEKAVCSKCGADVREGTAFCFACGGRVAGEEPAKDVGTSTDEIDAKAQAALDDLADKMRADDSAVASDEKLAKAAQQRKKARVTQRKSREFVWEPLNDTPIGFIIAVAVLAIAAILVIMVTVVWK